MKKGRSNFNFQINCNPEEMNKLIQSYLINDNYKQETKNGETYYKFSDSIKGYRGFNYTINQNTLNIQAWLIGVYGDMPVEENILNLALNMQIKSYKNSLESLFTQINNLNQNSSGNIIDNTQNINENMTNNNQNNNDNLTNENQNLNNNKTCQNCGQSISQDNSFCPQCGTPTNNNQNINTNKTCQNCGQSISQDNSFCPQCGTPTNNNIQSQQNFSNNINNQYIDQFRADSNKSKEKMCMIGFWLSIFGLFLSLVGYMMGIILYVFDIYAGINGLNTQKRSFAIATIITTVISIIIILMILLGVNIY